MNLSKRIFLLMLLMPFFENSLLAQGPSYQNIFHADSIKAIVSFLASDNLKGRYTVSKEAKIAAGYIADEFRKAGLITLPNSKDYFLPFKRKREFSSEIVQGINVAGMIVGKSKPEEIVIFSSHYDHVGTRKTNPFPLRAAGDDSRDKIYNGANDNASGTSAVITLAKYFASLKNNERTIVFICFSGEELGLLGSESFASTQDSLKTKAVVNIEMIGRGLDNRDANPYVTGDKFSDLITILNASLDAQKIDSSAKRIEFVKDRYEGQLLFTRSDNYPFALKNIPAHTIMLTSPADPFYHSVNDEAETLNFENMSLIIRAIAQASASIISGGATPVWLGPKN